MKNGDYELVVAPENFIGKKYRDKYCYEHHLVYWLNYGIVPQKDEVIHHKDGNKHNNSIDNLELQKLKNHNKIHHKGKQMIRVKCSYCGCEFIREKRLAHFLRGETTYACCSNRCSLAITHLDKWQKEQLTKPEILDEFII